MYKKKIEFHMMCNCLIKMVKDRFHNNFVVGLHHEARVKVTSQILSKNMLKHVVEKKPIHNKQH
jgi:hypothetical protein